MKKVLYIDCCIRRDGSRSRKLADCFLNELTGSREYEIEKITLMDESLMYMAEGFFLQRDDLLQNKEWNHPRFRYAHQFAQADKVVIAAPFWDLSFPALLKVYIENLCVEKITFDCDENGMRGLCTADHMVFITARGSIYSDSHLEMGSRYMEAMCEFFGIEKYTCITAEGLDLGTRPVDEIMQEAMKEAKTVAKTF